MTFSIEKALGRELIYQQSSEHLSEFQQQVAVFDMARSVFRQCAESAIKGSNSVYYDYEYHCFFPLVNQALQPKFSVQELKEAEKDNLNGCIRKLATALFPDNPQKAKTAQTFLHYKAEKGMQTPFPFNSQGERVHLAKFLKKAADGLMLDNTKKAQKSLDKKKKQYVHLKGRLSVLDQRIQQAVSKAGKGLVIRVSKHTPLSADGQKKKQVVLVQLQKLRDISEGKGATEEIDTSALSDAVVCNAFPDPVMRELQALRESLAGVEDKSVIEDRNEIVRSLKESELPPAVEESPKGSGTESSEPVGSDIEAHSVAEEPVAPKTALKKKATFSFSWKRLFHNFARIFSTMAFNIRLLWNIMWH